MVWLGNRRSVFAAGVCAGVAASLAIAGCGDAGSSSSTRRTASTQTIATSSAARHRPRPARRPRRPHPRGAPVGTAQRVNAGTSSLSVTVTNVLAALTASGATPPAGSHAVGVALTIRNEAGATYDSTASGDVSLVTSAGAAFPLFIKQGACQTPLTDFESLIGVGETRTGCVGFSVRRGARILSVRFSPHSRAAGSVTWR